MTADTTWQQEFTEESLSRGWLMPLKTTMCSENAARVLRELGANPDETDWSEEEVVLLHWRLLKRIELLRDPRTPLEEKIDVLRWIFTDPHLDKQPFSFVNCVRVVGISPLSPVPYFIGAADADEVREWVRLRLRQWLIESLQAYPVWIREGIVARPQWVAEQLERKPQWLNEQVRRHRVEGDLFA